MDDSYSGQIGNALALDFSGGRSQIGLFGRNEDSEITHAVIKNYPLGDITSIYDDDGDPIDNFGDLGNNFLWFLVPGEVYSVGDQVLIWGSIYAEDKMNGRLLIEERPAWVSVSKCTSLWKEFSFHDLTGEMRKYDVEEELIDKSWRDQAEQAELDLGNNEEIPTVSEIEEIIWSTPGLPDMRDFKFDSDD
tara:strand:- start:1616 stop:2188 length:573 start_codon:yes stop_codon:yes gene_type:complete